MLIENYMITAANYIKTFYTEIKNRRSSYSLRAFARDWGIQAGRASEIISGKRNLTQPLAILFIKNFDIDSDLSHKLLSQLKQEIEARKANLPTKKIISNQDFTKINHWQYYALLSLIEKSPFDTKSNWFAKKLGLSTEQINKMIQTLLELEILTLRQSHYEISSIRTTTEQDQLSQAIQQFHFGLTQQHLEKMKQLPPDLREIQALITSIHPKKLPKLKKMIRQFMTKFEKECFLDNEPHIYALSIYLSPLIQ